MMFCAVIARRSRGNLPSETRASVYYNSYGKTSYVELEEDISPFIYK